MECYKIVRRVGDRLYSLFENHFQVEYVPGRPAVPRIGKLFVFLNLEDAIQFGPDTGEEIWSCECENVTRLRKKILGTCSSPNLMRDYWDLEWIPADLLAPIIYGSFLADSVTLTRIMYVEENNGWRRIPAIGR